MKRIIVNVLGWSLRVDVSFIREGLRVGKVRPHNGSYLPECSKVLGDYKDLKAFVQAMEPLYEGITYSSNVLHLVDFTKSTTALYAKYAADAAYKTSHGDLLFCKGGHSTGNIVTNGEWFWINSVKKGK